MLGWDKTLDKLQDIKGELARYRVKFVDNKEFTKILTHLRNPVRSKYRGYRIKLGKTEKRDIANLYITGYIGDEISDYLIQGLKNGCNIQVISIHRRPILNKLKDNGVKIKTNKNMHARMMIGFSDRETMNNGFLLVGSFDLDKTSLGGDKKNAGIITTHPDLIKSAIDFFEEEWDDEYHTKPL